MDNHVEETGAPSSVPKRKPVAFEVTAPDGRVCLVRSDRVPAGHRTRALVYADEKAPAQEPVAWMRKWAAEGEVPEKVRNEKGRLVWKNEHKLLPVSKAKMLKDDAPLYISPPSSR